MNNCFRAEQECRLHEMRTCSEPMEEWPRGCRGSRRPWLVFIGPSPGGKKGADEGASPRWNRPFTDPFTPPFWGGGFKQSMQPLLRTLMPEATEAESTLLYAVYNFDSIQNPQASRVPSESMKRGAPGLLSLLEKSPPRLIVPMERRSFDVLRDELPQRGYKRTENYQFPIPIPISIYGNPKRFHRNIFGFRIDGTGPLKESVVVKLPQHPAKIFRADYATECGKVVRDLFERLAGVSE